LIITGTGGNKSITLKDNVIVGANLTVGSLSTSGNVTVSGNGKVLLSVYVNSANDVTDVGCRQTNGVTDTALGGGIDCHQDYDQMALRSHPTGVAGSPTGWYGLCMNHANSGITSAPQAIYVICAQYGK
jgi:hypothetical protein